MRNPILCLWLMAISTTALSQNVGIGTTTPTVSLSFANSLGNKIIFWGNGTSPHYGIGLQGALLQFYTDNAASNLAFGYGRSDDFKERVRIINNGDAAIDTKGRIVLRNGTDPVNINYGTGIWMYKADNSSYLVLWVCKTIKTWDFMVVRQAGDLPTMSSTAVLALAPTTLVLGWI